MNDLDILKKYIAEVWNKGNTEALDMLTTKDFHYNFANQKPRYRDDFIVLLNSMFKAFPDWHITIDDAISGRNKIVIRWSGEVTHGGEYMGIAATGNKVHVCGTNIYRFENNLIAEEWEQTNSLSWLSDMGVLGRL